MEYHKKVVTTMVAYYCRRHHSPAGPLCQECAELLDYACERLSHCPHGQSKPSCRKCRIHCYTAKRREQITCVMRYVGPRMLFISPRVALRHLLSELFG